MAKKLSGATAGAALLAAAAAGPAAAHHSFAAEFDQNQPVHIDGVVVEFQWVNPHSWVIVDVTDPETGEVTRWRAEAGAPSPLLRRGWTRDSLPAGTRVIIDGFRARDGDTRLNGQNLTFPDGTVMFMGSTGAGAPPTERPGGE